MIGEKDEVVKDPVCGRVKPKSQMKAYADYKGIRYYFCVERDKSMFLANPEHWISQTEEEMVKE